jgi:hypothetical protein
VTSFVILETSFLSVRLCEEERSKKKQDFKICT